MKIVTIRDIVLQLYLICFIPIAAVLLIYSLFINRKYQEDIRLTSNSAASLYQGQIESAMQDVQNKVVSVYLKDNVGFQLERKQKAVEKYNLDYELNSRFSEFLSIDQRIAAYYIFYAQYSMGNFSYDEELTFDSMSELKYQLKNLISERRENNQWDVIITDDIPYLVYTYGKGGVAISCAINLQKFRPDTEDGTSLRYVYEGNYLGEERRDYDPERSKSASDDISKNGFVSVMQEVPGTSLQLLYVVPVSSASMIRATRFFIFIIIFVISLGILLSISVAKRALLKPIEEGNMVMHQIGNGDMDLKMDLHSNLSELVEMQTAFNTMIDHIGRLKIEKYEEQVKAKSTQLEFLRLQIKPHFFLNCLTNLHALAQPDKLEKLKDNIFRISDYLRYAFSSSFNPVPLKEELRFAENYVNIQRGSYSYGIELHMDIAPDTLEIPVPSLLVETFVENSIKYAAPEGVLAIHIHTAKLQNDDGAYLDLTVSDNGKGYAEDWIEAVNEDKAVPENGHVGFTNLKQRLDLLYKGEAILALWNDDGAVAEIILPCDRNEFYVREDREVQV